MIFVILLSILLICCLPTVLGSGKVTAEDEFDHLLVSFPKSGRTWLRLLIGEALSRHFKLDADEKKRLKLAPLASENPRVPRIVVDHVYNTLEFTDPKEWTLPEGVADRSVILLIRDPRDAVVSNFFQKRYRHSLQFDNIDEMNCDDYRELASHKFPWKREPFCNQNKTDCSCFPQDYTVKDFIEEAHGGFETTCAYSTFFFQQRHKMRQLYVLRYEDLLNDTAGELSRLFLHIGITNASNETIHGAVAETSFKAMQKKEDEGAFGKRLSAADSENELTRKTRSGTIGGFRNFVGDDAALMAKMARTMLDILPREFGYTKAFVHNHGELGRLAYGRITDLPDACLDSLGLVTSVHDEGHWLFMKGASVMLSILGLSYVFRGRLLRLLSAHEPRHHQI